MPLWPTPPPRRRGEIEYSIRFFRVVLFILVVVLISDEKEETKAVVLAVRDAFLSLYKLRSHK